MSGWQLLPGRGSQRGMMIWWDTQEGVSDAITDDVLKAAHRINGD